MPTISTFTVPLQTHAARTQPAHLFTNPPNSPRRKPGKSAVTGRSTSPANVPKINVANASPPNPSTPGSNSSPNKAPIQATAAIHNTIPIQNRIGILLVHISIFSIRGQARLAEEIGMSRSTISRLVHGKINPSYRLARAVTDALERKMGRHLDIREVFSTDGTYPTPSGCSLCQCHGCLPSFAWGTDNALKPEWQDARPGDWSLARPSGSNTSFNTVSDRGAGEENR